MRVLSVIALFGTLFFQANQIDGNKILTGYKTIQKAETSASIQTEQSFERNYSNQPNDNADEGLKVADVKRCGVGDDNSISIQPKYQLLVGLEYKIPGSNKVEKFTFEILTDGEESLKTHLAVNKKLNNITEIITTKYSGQLSYIKRECAVEIYHLIDNTRFNNDRLEELLNEIKKQEPSGIMTKYIIGIHYAKSGTLKEKIKYSILIVIEFNIANSDKTDISEILIKTDTENPLYTGDVLKKMTKLKSDITKKYGISAADLERQVVISVITSPDIVQWDHVDSNRKTQLLKDILEKEFSSKKYTVFVTIIYKIPYNDKEFKQVFEIETHVNSPLDGAALERKVNDAQSKLNKQIDVNETDVEITHYFETKFNGIPTRSESDVLDNKMARIRQVVARAIQPYLEKVEYILVAAIQFQKPNSDENISELMEIKTDTKTPLDTDELVEQINELKIGLTEKYGVIATDFEVTQYTYVISSPYEILLDSVDSDKKTQLVEYIFKKEFSSKQLNVVITIIYTILGNDEEFERFFVIETDVNLPLDVDSIEREVRNARSNLKGQIDVNELHVDETYLVEIKFDIDPTPSESALIANKIAKIRRVLDNIN